MEPPAAGGICGNGAETLSRREGNTCTATSAPGAGILTLETQKSELVLRCECGETITALSEGGLVELARLHLGEFHPDLGANVPADLILAMAEEMEETRR